MCLASSSPCRYVPHTSGFTKMHTLLIQWAQIFKTPKVNFVIALCRKLPRDHELKLALCDFVRNRPSLHWMRRGEWAVRATADRYVMLDGNSDSDRWTYVGVMEREGLCWWWMDGQRGGRRRAAIRTKTSVTFRGFSLLPSVTGPWSKPHRLHCVMVCVALLCGPASGDWTNHDSAEAKLRREEKSTASLLKQVSLDSHYRHTKDRLLWMFTDSFLLFFASNGSQEGAWMGSFPNYHDDNMLQKILSCSVSLLPNCRNKGNSDVKSM